MPRCPLCKAAYPEDPEETHCELCGARLPAVETLMQDSATRRSRLREGTGGHPGNSRRTGAVQGGGRRAEGPPRTHMEQHTRRMPSPQRPSTTSTRASDSTGRTAGRTAAPQEARKRSRSLRTTGWLTQLDIETLSVLSSKVIPSATLCMLRHHNLRRCAFSRDPGTEGGGYHPGHHSCRACPGCTTPRASPGPRRARGAAITPGL